jgi:hypothetical protein
MACKYEEEVFTERGRIEGCKCDQCPFKNLEDCKKVEVKGLEVDRQDHLHFAAEEN